MRTTPATHSTTVQHRFALRPSSILSLLLSLHPPTDRPTFPSSVHPAPGRLRWRMVLAVLIIAAIASSIRIPVATAQPRPDYDLARIEQSIQNVAAQNRDACIAIFDGVGVGSGVIISSDGLVLTAGHVMSTDQPQYEVFLSDGRTVLARRLGRNLSTDTGMVKLDGDNWPHVKLGSTAAMKNGDWVVSLGHSGGFELGRKSPVRSGRLLSIKGHQLITDAVLIGGDSGGPLFNLQGELIGIHSSIGDAVDQNRHARIEEFRKDWDRLRRGDSWGQLPPLVAKELTPGKAKLGVRVDLTSQRATIKSVKPGSPAARIGLQPRDVVIQFDGEIITDGRHLIRAVAAHVPADTCFIKIDRDNEILNLEVRLQ